MDNKQKLKAHTLLSVLTIAVGLLLLVYMIIAESEPGAIPLLLIVFSAGWYFYTRNKIRRHGLE